MSEKDKRKPIDLEKKRREKQRKPRLTPEERERAKEANKQRLSLGDLNRLIPRNPIGQGEDTVERDKPQPKGKPAEDSGKSGEDKVIRRDFPKPKADK